MYDFKIGVISTYSELSKQIIKMAEEIGLQVDLKEGILEEGVRHAYQLEREGADVIVSRGVTGRMISNAVSLPVVLVDITSFDILQALYSAKKMGRRIAYLGHRNYDFNPEFDSITNILGMEVECYPYANDNDMNEQMGKILGDNVDVVVSTGQCIYQAAKQSGANAILVQSGSGAVFSALRRATDLVQSIRRDQHRAERFRSVLELTNDGILIVNESKCVSFMNPSAEKLLNLDAGNVLGHHVDDLRASPLLGPLLVNSGKIAEVFKEVGHKQFLVNSMPIKKTTSACWPITSSGISACWKRRRSRLYRIKPKVIRKIPGLRIETAGGSNTGPHFFMYRKLCSQAHCG